MDFYKPTNLRLTGYFSGSVGIVWDEIGDKSRLDSYLIYGQKISDGLWEVISSDKNNYAIVSGPYSALRVSAILSDGTETDFSNVIPIALNNASDIIPTVIVGQDGSGKRRLLATDSNGVLMVTGATVNNYGGDATASKQDTQITQLNTLASKLDASTNAINSIASQLNTLGLGASTVAALQSVSVTNLPTNFPDSATTAAITNLASVTATESTLQGILSGVNALIKPSDIARDISNKIIALVDNLPNDYPDSAAAALLSNMLPKLDSLIGTTGQISLNTGDSALSQIDIRDLLSDIKAAVLSISSDSSSISGDASGINAKAGDIITAIAALQLALDAVSVNTLGAVKAADLNLDSSKNLGVAVVNFPGDFPNSTGNSLLSDVKNILTDMAIGVNANFAGPLPAGNNLIGQVINANAVLADNAATESSLRIISNLLSENNAKTTALINQLEQISNNLVLLKTRADFGLGDRKLIFDQIVPVTESSRVIRLLDMLPSEDVPELNKYEKYFIQMLTYSASVSVTLRHESSFNNQIFYHEISTHSLAPSSSKSVTITNAIQNLSFLVKKSASPWTNLTDLTSDAIRIIITATR